MLKGAKRHKTVMDVARFYTDAFMADCEKLSIKRPDVVEPATNCIPEFIHEVGALGKRICLYSRKVWHFDTSKVDNYYVYLLRMKKGFAGWCHPRMLKKIQIREIRQTLFFGLQIEV